MAVSALRARVMAVNGSKSRPHVSGPVNTVRRRKARTRTENGKG